MWQNPFWGFVFGSASVIWSLSHLPLTDIHFVSAGMMSWQTRCRSPRGRDDERCFRQTARYTDSRHVSARTVGGWGGILRAEVIPLIFTSGFILKAWTLWNLQQILYSPTRGAAITPGGREGFLLSIPPADVRPISVKSPPISPARGPEDHNVSFSYCYNLTLRCNLR